MIRKGSMSDHIKKLSQADRNKVALVGIMDRKTYPDGELVAQVGFWNDYGTHNIPPRPFFRAGVADSRPEAMRVLALSLEKGNGAEKSLLLSADVVRKQIRDNILTWSEPPNALSTIRAKGYNAPLRGPDRLLRNYISTAIEGAGQ